MELKVKWREMILISWAFVWRFLICICIDITALGTTGAIIASNSTGHPFLGCQTDPACDAATKATIHSFVGIFMLAMPIFAIICLRLIIAKDYGKFYLTIVRKPPKDSASAAIDTRQ